MTMISTPPSADVVVERGAWVPICSTARIVPDRGVAALIGGRAVAVFLLSTGEVASIDAVDPVSGACVLSRGIVGDVDGVPTVASPMYKDRFDLRTGRCLDRADVAVRVHEAEVRDGQVRVRVAADG